MTGPLSRRAADMPPFIVMEVLERAAALEAQGREVIHLEVGEPDFDTPAVVRAAAVRALEAGATHYTHSLGHPELRQALCDWMRAHYAVEVDPGRVVVTCGSSAALQLVCLACLDPGDLALMSDPGYACYPNFVRACSGEPVRIPVGEADGFQLDPAEVARHLGPRTRLLLLNSPANPTGIVTPPERLRALAEVARGRVQIVSDEIYHGLTYAAPARSILEFESGAIVVSGFSKLFAMTGWRLGYAILPEWLVRPVQKLQQNLYISAPDFAQRAAVVALREAGPAVLEMRQAYDQRRRLMLRRLGEMGLRVAVEPTGAFYVFVNVARYTKDVYRFAFDLLEQTGVAVTPGIDFGPGGEGFIRLSYCNSVEAIERGLARLEAYLAAFPLHA